MERSKVTSQSQPGQSGVAQGGVTRAQECKQIGSFPSAVKKKKKSEVTRRLLLTWACLPTNLKNVIKNE